MLCYISRKHVIINFCESVNVEKGLLKGTIPSLKKIEIRPGSKE